MSIHPTAIVDPAATIDSSAQIGPYAIVEGPVQIGARVRVHAHACISGWTQIAEDCEIFPHACIGYPPQDRAYDGSETYCTIGAGTVIREGSSVHRGTGAGTTTRIGSHCFLMANSHVAHNCQVADNVTLANGVLLAGHVHLGPRVFMGGCSVVHQFVHIGELAMIAGLARVAMDVPPFFLAGSDNRCLGVNGVGMRRAGLTPAELREIRQSHQLLYRSSLPFARAIERLSTTVQTPAGARLVEFLREPSRRGIIPARSRGSAPQPADTAPASV